MANTIKQEDSLVGYMQSDKTLSGNMNIPEIYKETVSNPATKDTLGLIKVGDNLTIENDGTLSADVPTKTSDLENDSGFITEEEIPVRSVNGETGDVKIEIPEAYELPVASEEQLGGVKANSKTADMTTPVGIDEDGNLWVHAGADVDSIDAEKVMFNGDMVLTEAFGRYKPSGGKE